MPTVIEVVSDIDAVPGVVFGLEVDVDVHAASLRGSQETATTSTGRRQLALGDEVTCRARHFGVRWCMTSLRALAATEFTAEDPTVISSAYQQILAVLNASASGMRAKDICLAPDIEPLPKHVEGTRAKPKRLVSRQIPTEIQPGIFALAPKGT